jgi:hypothetical protein
MTGPLWKARRMDARGAARTYLPARIQDAARSALDLVSPARRRAGAVGADELAARVSPDGSVLAGPFAGMRLSPQSSWGGGAARLAGTYEEELAGQLELLLAARPSLVIDVGASDGYYAVGMALRLPAAEVVAYDIDPRARALCMLNAALNGATNVRVRGRATVSVLRRHLRPGALVMCDCEGYEGELIDPERIPSLRSCSLLVELHESLLPGVSATVISRFERTHSIAVVDAVPRLDASRQQLAHLTRAEALRAVDEGRPDTPPMQWAVMVPRRPTTFA